MKESGRRSSKRPTSTWTFNRELVPHGQGASDADSRERLAAFRVPSRRGRRRSRPRLPGRSGRRRGRRSRSRIATSPAFTIPRWSPPLERERLYGVITRKALAWSVASAQPAEIDDINIHRASLEAMRRAVMTLAPLPDLVLVDAFRIPELLMAQRGRAARRSALHVDRGGVDRGEGDARSRDARVPCRPIRATATTGTRATPRRTTSPLSRSTGIRRCIAAPSGRPPCLIRS